MQSYDNLLTIRQYFMIKACLNIGKLITMNLKLNFYKSIFFVITIDIYKYGDLLVVKQNN